MLPLSNAVLVTILTSLCELLDVMDLANRRGQSIAFQVLAVFLHTVKKQTSKDPLLHTKRHFNNCMLLYLLPMHLIPYVVNRCWMAVCILVRRGRHILEIDMNYREPLSTLVIDGANVSSTGGGGLPGKKKKPAVQ